MRIGSPASVGVLGKIPAHGDFIRLNAKGAAGEAFFDWLQVCLDRLNRDGLELGTAPATFVFPVESTHEILLGVLASSRDKVGRRFPFTVFQTLPIEGCLGKLAALLHASAAHLEMMRSLVEERNEIAPAAISERIARLCQPVSLDLDGAAQTLRSLPVTTLSDPSFMGLSPEQMRSALAGLEEACRPFVGRKPPSKNATVAACPVRGPESTLFWIELAERILSWPQSAPGVLLANQEGPRCLLALGPLPAYSLTWLCKPEACRNGIVALAEALSVQPSSPGPEIPQEGTLIEFFASLRPLGTP